MERLADALCQPYVGDADAKFLRYLMRCCKNYYDAPAAYVAPGKDADDKELPESETFDARLLYVCARSNKRSTGFPVATPELSEVLFGNANMIRPLEVALEYAIANWESASDWLALFGVDPAVNANACKRGPEAVGPPTKRQRLVGATPNKALASALQSIIDTDWSRSSREVASQDERRVKVLVLAVDEARSLLEKEDAYGVNYLCNLRSDLDLVNRSMMMRKVCGAGRHEPANRRLGPIACQGRTPANQERHVQVVVPAVRAHPHDGRHAEWGPSSTGSSV
ncbi:hypothetical protein PHYPSEUDO_013367 [Phytophthora pseudosyringae]|uniref:Uncharacterized protein n=1 Tax=Phytophthora pseudosyringae TaxID=221518 RepID=A0A8T1W8C2_9STRA|nr:hypothetical protein PHYPSEUDO_013367 [Phytophthora pseudosyringae]